MTFDDALSWTELDPGKWRAWHKDDIGTYAIYEALQGHFYAGFRHLDTDVMLYEDGPLGLAMRTCQDHHDKTRREKRWAEYMLNNEPPEVQ